MAQSKRYVPLMMLRAPNGMEAIVLRDDVRGGVASTSGTGAFREDGDPEHVADRLLAWADAGTRTAGGRNVDVAVSLEPAMNDVRSADFRQALARAARLRPGTASEPRPRIGIPARGPGANPFSGLRRAPTVPAFTSDGDSTAATPSLAAAIPLPADPRHPGADARNPEARVHLDANLPIAAVEIGSRGDVGRERPSTGATFTSPAGAARLALDAHAAAAASTGDDPERPAARLDTVDASAPAHEEFLAAALCDRRGRDAALAAHEGNPSRLRDARERAHLLLTNTLTSLDPAALLEEAGHLLAPGSGPVAWDAEVAEYGPLPVKIDLDREGDGGRRLRVETRAETDAPGTLDIEACHDAPPPARPGARAGRRPGDHDRRAPRHPEPRRHRPRHRLP